MGQAAGIRCLVYCRISQDRTGAEHGVERQEEDCRALAAKLGYTVVEVYVDNDISAFSGKTRPNYRRMLADLASGRGTAVIAWHTDRLHRSPLELEEYVTLAETHGIITNTVKAGEIDLSTPSGRAVARTLGAWARFESEHKSDRIRRSRLQAATEGRWHGGIRPFGFEADGVTIRFSEAIEIPKAANVLLAGTSLRSVTTEWNRRGILTALGNTWTTQTVREVLLRPRNAGKMVYHGEIIGDAPWAELISLDTHLALKAMFADPERRTSPGNVATWLGSGLYLCGQEPCTSTVICTTTGGAGKPSYRCNASRTLKLTGHVSRNAEAVDKLVEQLVIKRLERPDAIALLSDGEIDTTPLHAQATLLRQRLQDLANLYGDGDINTNQLKEGSRKIREQIDTVEASIAAAARVNPLAGLIGPNVAERWKPLDIGRKKAVVDALFTVTINHQKAGRMPDGSYFDPRAIQIDWRGSAAHVVPSVSIERRTARPRGSDDPG